MNLPVDILNNSCLKFIYVFIFVLIYRLHAHTHPLYHKASKAQKFAPHSCKYIYLYRVNNVSPSETEAITWNWAYYSVLMNN